jgi:ABC-2 type transport system permease protein
VTQPSLLTQVAQLGRRSFTRTIRTPIEIVPGLVFPLFLLAVNAAGLDAATAIPGFPTDSYLAFALAIPFIQGALFATMNAGAGLARDIESGFFNRLSLTPMRGSALLAGQLAGALTLGVIQSAVYIAVGYATGVDFAAGLPGVLVMFALSLSIALALGTIGLLLALRTGSGEAVQGFFPLFFVFLFLSSMALPRDLIEQDWFQAIATYNPVSYLLEGIRSLVITGWDGQALGQAFGIAAVIFIAGLTLSSLSLRTRMVRT